MHVSDWASAIVLLAIFAHVWRNHALYAAEASRKQNGAD